MLQPSLESITLLAFAVELRIHGADWEEVAKQTGHPVQECRLWPFKLRVVWKWLLDRARMREIKAAAAEAEEVLRKLCYSKDEKIARSTQKFMRKHGLKW